MRAFIVAGVLWLGTLWHLCGGTPWHLCGSTLFKSITITTLEAAILEPITLGQDTNEQIYVGDIKDDD